MHWLRFASLWLRYPEQREFLSMGLGISERYKRCLPYWQRHLQHTRALQRTGLQAMAPGSRVHIFGCGRGLDIEAEWLLKRKCELQLWDADPGVARKWRSYSLRYPCQVTFHQGDFSGMDALWRKALREYLRTKRSHQDITDFLLQHPLSPPAPVAAEAALSLNVLSQIAVFARDYLQKVLIRYQRMKVDRHGRFSASVETLLHKFFARLQQEHLELLFRTQAKIVLLSFDQDFFYFRPDQAPWQREQALYIDPSQCLESFEISAEREWWWDIAPQGIENNEYSQVHRVRGLILRRQGSDQSSGAEQKCDSSSSCATF